MSIGSGARPISSGSSRNALIRFMDSSQAGGMRRGALVLVLSPSPQSLILVLLLLRREGGGRSQDEGLGLRTRTRAHFWCELVSGFVTALGPSVDQRYTLEASGE